MISSFFLIDIYLYKINTDIISLGRDAPVSKLHPGKPASRTFTTAKQILHDLLLSEG